MDSCPSGPGGGGGVFQTSPSDTQNAGTKGFTGAVVAKNLPWMFLFVPEKKTPAPAIQITSKNHFFLLVEKVEQFETMSEQIISMLFFVAL